MALVEFSKHSRRDCVETVAYAHIEVGLKMWHPRRYRCYDPRTVVDDDASAKRAAVWKSNLQPDFNVSVRDSFDAISSAVLREPDESNRFVEKSAESTSM